MNEFLIGNGDPNDFVVVHAADVARYEKGRVLSPAGPVLQNNAADHRADFLRAPRDSRYREALTLGLIDPEP
jgi:hypothetical protein